ncbi:MAG: branched-chain amino acid ABC transporter permease, partial [Mesorhizobium sp.]
MSEATLHEERLAASVRLERGLVALGIAALVAAPFLIYPIFVMKMLCFALFACAFNLLLGYTGLLS